MKKREEHDELFHTYWIGDHVLCTKPFDKTSGEQQIIYEAVITGHGGLCSVVDFLNPTYEPGQAIYNSDIITKVA